MKRIVHWTRSRPFSRQPGARVRSGCFWQMILHTFVCLVIMERIFTFNLSLKLKTRNACQGSRPVRLEPKLWMCSSNVLVHNSVPTLLELLSKVAIRASTESIVLVNQAATLSGMRPAFKSLTQTRWQASCRNELESFTNCSLRCV